MIIPWQELAPETLDNLIAEFVSRDGTDYGEQEYSLEQKQAQVRAALARGEAVLIFSQRLGQCNIVPVDRVSDWDDSEE
ncbi:YheU family protein [Marinobacterium weihaiense]|uniref:YheU family protein n=1 Tax=Marinobacterium weihaiense TaxID=2851016 RepID=A0ABS6ME38_9GAMM|nr:YheU family protein [Marinobacterium weihaiense]MBV0934544.1 YheU family protein [Marinobacterium weihaiense]